MVVDGGRVVTDDTLDAVRAGVDLRRVSLTSAEPPAVAGVVRTESEGTRHQLFTPDADALVRELVTSGTDFTGLEVAAASLEEAFLALTHKRPSTHQSPSPTTAGVPS